MNTLGTTTQREPDFAARTVNFRCVMDATEVACRISFDAFAVYFGLDSLNRRSILEAFDENRDQIELAAVARHERGLHEWDGSLFLEADDLASVARADEGAETSVAGE
jgi:hypothetical protein